MSDSRYQAATFWRPYALGIGLVACSMCLLTSGAAVSAERSPAADALQSIFNPQHAPAQKTMGLLQRSFLDLVEDAAADLQVALVIDGTNSMSRDLEGVRATLRSMVEDLRRYKGERVSFALVVYRDSGAPSGEITIPLKQFTSDPAVLERAFSEIEAESGAPYFLELPDLGVHDALDRLDWKAGEATTRWLLLFGDAPPYDPDFVDQEHQTGARRRYDNDVLTDLAVRKGVQISCVLCTSRDEEQEVYRQVLDRTRGFMNDLATRTGGLMLDLSYPDIRQALIDSAREQRVGYQKIGRITSEDIAEVRQAAEQRDSAVAQSQRLQLVVLPHLPLNAMQFDPDLPAVQVGAELRMKLRQIPHVDVRSPVEVERQMRRLPPGQATDEQWLQALAVRLRADYVVWGSYKSAQGVVSVRSAIYTKADARKLAEAEVLTSETLPETQLASNLASRLVGSAAGSSADPTLAATLAAFQQDQAATKQLVTPVSHNAEAHRALLAGFEALEQALAWPLGSAEATPLLDKAARNLNEAAQIDVRNPLAHQLLASCYFNQAQLAVHQGRPEEAQRLIEQFAESLKRAYREKDSIAAADVKREIEGDYALLIKRDFAEAVSHYQALVERPRSTALHTVLRAHWMLAGIYSGDWGVDEKFVQADQARLHLLQILAHWPDSSEAKFVKDNLRWDETKGGNQFQHFPQRNKLILAGMFGE